MTKRTEKLSFSGWVLYDGECRLCTGLARRVRPALTRRGFVLQTLQTPWVAKRLGLEAGV